MAHSDLTILESLTSISLDSLNVPSSANVLCALSGGADSMTMAAVLNALCRSSRIARLGLVHINHQLRGLESDLDEQLVRDFASANNLPLYVKHSDTLRRAEDDHTSIEIAARDIRYEFFTMLLSEGEYTYLVTAHTANDNLETVLINMIRGTGLRGLRGIPAIRELADDRFVIRPWLDIERDDVLRYQSAHSVPFRYDTSNAEYEFLRNRIRHTVIPALISSFGERNIYKGFRRTVRILNDTVDEQILNAVIDSSMCLIPLDDDYLHRERVGIAVDFIETVGPTRRRELLQRIFQTELKITDPPVLDSSRMMLVNMFIESPDKRGLQLRDDILMYREQIEDTVGGAQDVIVVEHIPTSQNGRKIQLYPPPTSSVTTILGEIRTHISQVHDIKFVNGNAYFDAKIIGDRKIYLRRWIEGDKIFPFGMSGHRKLVSDLFNEAGVPGYLKKSCLVAVLGDDDRVIWVPGIRAAEFAAITNQTETVLVLERTPKQKRQISEPNEADDDDVF